MTFHCATPSLRDSGPAPTSPTATGRAAPSLAVIAKTLDCSKRQAEVLIAIASGCADRRFAASALRMTDGCLKVHVHNLRKQHWNIHTHSGLSYFLSPEHRSIVWAAAGRPLAPTPVQGPVGAVSSLWTDRSANAAVPFQPTGDLTRQVSELQPTHQPPPVHGNQQDGERHCIPTERTNSP